MFVGMTRAQEELQLSMARYRDFRGQRKPTIPSSFLMELPRTEMDLEFPEAERRVPAETWHDEEIAAQSDEAHFDDVHEFAEDGPTSDGRPVDTAALRVPGMISLTTAAALANGGKAAPSAPDAFCQGMLVLHGTYGLGQVVALSGSGAGRKATVDFQPPAGRKRLLLADGSLQPVGA